MTKFAFFAAVAAVTVSGLTHAMSPSMPSHAQAATDRATATASATHAVIKPGDRQCIRDTGSLIKPKKGECLPVSGRSYTKQDIDNTGERTLGPALQKLDPSVTLHGNGY